MLSYLFGSSRPRRKSNRENWSPFASPFNTIRSPVGARRAQTNARRRIAADYDESDGEEEDRASGERERLLHHDADDYDEDEDEEEYDEQVEGEDEDDEDGHGDTTPLLPIFSAAHLDSLPIYNLTHSIRLLVVSRVETTLTWDQLRSPQVSQFLVKPIQQQIHSSHFSRATLYALMANCLQFTKEVGVNLGMSGTNKTRAMVCELVAMRLLKEFSTRELIDALAYDFDPLQGQIRMQPTGGVARQRQPRVARTSCLEVAIRASAKRFLAHPLVVQQLEAIWAGSIVFHSAADSMHRKPGKTTPNQIQGYGSMANDRRVVDVPSKIHSAKQREHLPPVEVLSRRAVTLYDPQDASLFKLSRLRVPRYRSIASTLSFAVLLGLFIAVLVERPLNITPLEIMFWIWSAGYMLDEIVGFNEQGFSLYLASFWNTFDLGILLLLLVHLCLRIYGIVMVDVRKRYIANMAYDVLAAAAVLLFPRLFSVLDHYRYFSQLLIAFRIMAIDFLAIFVLIIISCSGFFVALTLSFGNDEVDNPRSVAYALLQLLMGFTPAAWERWDGYNGLGKTLLVLFMFITHFLVVTILITVLTNSFMSIVQNANDEHQFLFAVNAISAVKSDSLFSYVAPTNILGWLLTPLRYILPFRRYVKLNRTVIKVTHFPILFIIFAYEKTMLRSEVFEPTDLVEARGRAGRPRRGAVASRFLSPRPARMVREPSIATFQKDQALEEVFRRPFRDASRNIQASQERRKTSNAVNTWMNDMDETGELDAPPEQDQSILDRLEARKSAIRARRSQNIRNQRDFTDRSVASNPEETIGNPRFLLPPGPSFRGIDIKAPAEGSPHADADDELLTNEPDDDDKTTTDRQPSIAQPDDTSMLSSTVRRIDYFQHIPKSRPRTPLSSSQGRTRFVSPPAAGVRTISRRQSPTRSSPKRPHHSRNVSSATILYNPRSERSQDKDSSTSSSQNISPTRVSRKNTSARTSAGIRSGHMTPASGGDGHRTPKKPTGAGMPRARPVMPTSQNAAFRSVPDLSGLVPMGLRRAQTSGGRGPTSFDLGSDIGDNKAIGGGWLGQAGGFPASYTTSSWMQHAAQSRQQGGQPRRRHSADEDDHESESEGDNQTGMFGRLMLARMNNLESGFREVVSEMRDHLRRDEPSAQANPPGSQAGKLSRAQSTRKDVKGKERERDVQAQRPVTRRKKSAFGRGAGGSGGVRSKGNSEIGRATTADADWVDDDAPASGDEAKSRA